MIFGIQTIINSRPWRTKFILTWHRWNRDHKGGSSGV